MDKCTFNTCYGNKSQRDIFSECWTRKSDSNRINLTMSVSKKAGNILHEPLAPLVKANPNLKIEYHLTCAGKSFDMCWLVRQRSE